MASSITSVLTIIFLIGYYFRTTAPAIYSEKEKIYIDFKNPKLIISIDFCKYHKSYKINYSMGIVLDTLICFSKICEDKKEPAFFRGNDNSAFYNFFYKMSLKYPDELKGLTFLKGEHHYINFKIEEEWNDLKLRQEVHPWGRNHHPFETSKRISRLYDTVKDKETFNKIAQDFYNELGCDKEGKMRKKIDYNTIDFDLL